MEKLLPMKFSKLLARRKTMEQQKIVYNFVLTISYLRLRLGTGNEGDERDGKRKTK